MKKILGIVLCLALLFGCAALAEADEDGQSPIMNIIGDYADRVGQRAVMHIDCGSGDSADITINWGNSAKETVVWRFNAVIGMETDEYAELNYTDCTKSIVRFENEDSEGETEIVYENGTGKLIWYKDGEDGEESFIWQDDVEDAGRGCEFVFSPKDNTFRGAGVPMGASEAEVRGTLGDPSEEKTVDGGKELIYESVKYGTVDMKGHFVIMDDMVRAMWFETHNGNSDVANDISVCNDEQMDPEDSTIDDITEDRVKALGTKYCGIREYPFITYAANYALDGTMLLYIRTSENDIYVLALDHMLQEQ